MKTIVFDTETTGLPERKGWNQYFHPSDEEKYERSRLIQLGFIVIDENGKPVIKKSYIIKPEGFTITNQQIHGICNNTALQKGKPLKSVLQNFNKILEDCDTIVAHNIDFDCNIVLAECYRLGLETLIYRLETIKRFCTMKYGKQYIGKHKSPRLKELYEYLYPNETWIQKHDALDDAHICLACYLELTKKIC